MVSATYEHMNTVHNTILGWTGWYSTSVLVLQYIMELDGI